MIRKGCKVKLRSDALVKHSRSVPAWKGYTREQFKWRETLRKLKGRTGLVTRTFPNSNNVNVKFGKTLIGINKTQLKEYKPRKKTKAKPKRRK
jgi:hypothetical protein